MTNSEKNMLREYLKNNRLMTLATSDDKPWVSTVYYVCDKDLNLFFITSPETDHGKMIKKNNNVACNIVDSTQAVVDKKVGMQIQGHTEMVTALNAVKKMLLVWHNANPGKEKILSLKNMMNKVVDARVYKIIPTKIRFFNEELYKDEEYKTFILNNSLII